ncbi:MAG TPA: LamG domain-containing protein [Methylomirabilota bacterium]|nr:LamG domain-containing protein [Methylomirabilota bacterium]
MSRTFNGSSDHISCGSSTTLIAPALSVFCWINPTSLTNAFSAIFNRLASNSVNTNGDYFLHVKSNGKLALGACLSTGTSTYDGTGGQTITTGSWYHIGFTSPNPSDHVTGYVNGILDDFRNGGNGNFATTSVQNFILGYNSYSAGLEFAGRIADVGVWSEGLTASEVASLAQGHRPFQVRPQALVGWWPLDGLSSPEPDLSVNVNNGVLTGTTLSLTGPPVNLLTQSPGFFSGSPLDPQSMLKQIKNSLSAPDGSEYGTLTDGAGTLVVTSTTSTGSLKQIKNSRIAPDGSKYMTLTDGNGNLV